MNPYTELEERINQLYGQPQVQEHVEQPVRPEPVSSYPYEQRIHQAFQKQDKGYFERPHPRLDPETLGRMKTALEEIKWHYRNNQLFKDDDICQLYNLPRHLVLEMKKEAGRQLRFTDIKHQTLLYLRNNHKIINRNIYKKDDKYYISKDYHGRRIDLPVRGDLQHARAVRDKLEEEKWNTHFVRGYRWGGK